MNTQTKPELFAPCFPMLSIKKSGIEVDADNVQFSFVVGSESIDCEIKAVELTDSMYVEQQFHPEFGRDVDYTKLEVDNKTLALVTRSDFDKVEASSTAGKLPSFFEIIDPAYVGLDDKTIRLRLVVNSSDGEPSFALQIVKEQLLRNEIIQEFKEKVIALLPENPVRIGTFSA